jgi:hypothetical protein
MEQMDIWPWLLVIFLILMFYFLFRSLSLGKKFRARQELRQEQYLERKRAEAAMKAASRAFPNPNPSLPNGAKKS